MFDEFRTTCLDNDLLLLLTALVVDSDPETSQAAAQAAHAFIARPEMNLSNGSEDSLSAELWLIISEGLLVGQGNDVIRSHGLSLWLRLLSTRSCHPIILRWLRKPEYFGLLRQILQGGTPEQQKLGLAIFRLSIDVSSKTSSGNDSSDSRQIAHHCSHYLKWATVYETVVLGGYLNQVEECLPEFSILADSTSPVDPSWMMVLLQAAFHSQVRGSIAKVIATWVMQSSQSLIIRADVAGVDFLRLSWLPWAATGALYISSVAYRDLDPVCSHGEAVSGYLEHLIVASASEPRLLTDVVTSTLRFVKAQRHQVTFFARAYILEGLLRGLELSQSDLDASCAELLSDICRVTGFIEVSQEYMTFILLRMRALVRETRASEVNQETPNQSEASSSALAPDHGSHEASNSKQPTVREMFLNVSKSECRNLSGPGLSNMCKEMSVALNEDDAVDPNEVSFMIQAIWDETEIQDYLREILIRLPKFILHKRVLSLASQHANVIEVCRTVLSELDDLSKSRIYAFSALARAWWYAAGTRKFPPNLLPLLHEFLVIFAKTPPVPKADFKMEAIIADKLGDLVLSRSYEYYYDKPVHVAYAYVFLLLSSISQRTDSTQFCQSLLDELLDPWISLKDSTAVFVPWKSTTQLQVILILNEQVTSSCAEDEASGYLQKYQHVLSLEQNPRYRYLLEWIIARLLYHHNPLRWNILRQQAECDLSNPKYAASIIKLTLLLVQLPDADEDFATELSVQLTVLAASIRVSIRHEAHWTIPQLWDLAQSRSWRSIIDNEAFKRLNKWIRGLEIFKEPPAWRHLDGLDPVTDHNLTHLVSGKYLEIEPPEMARSRYRDFEEVLHETQQA
ncbi:MAG: hypothetical protein Q9162_007962, partial [Coniocarpon cinnabarinum]